MYGLQGSGGCAATRLLKRPGDFLKAAQISASLASSIGRDATPTLPLGGRCRTTNVYGPCNPAPSISTLGSGMGGSFTLSCSSYFASSRPADAVSLRWVRVVEDVAMPVPVEVSLDVVASLRLERFPLVVETVSVRTKAPLESDTVLARAAFTLSFVRQITRPTPGTGWPARSMSCPYSCASAC